MAIVINGTGTIAGVSATGITTAPTNATDASKLPLTGGALTGNLVVGGTITQNKSGDSMYLNRTSDDGNILRLQREGSTKAALGVTSNNLTLEVGGTTRMTITSAGLIGIGVTDPDSKLEVNGNMHLSGNLRGKQDSTTEIGGAFNVGGIKRIHMVQGGELRFGDTTNTNPLGITEGAWNNFGDQDYLSIHFRSKLELYASNGSKRLRIDGDGIKFNTDTAAANALDDYEEGTYNVVVSGSASGTFNMDSNDTLAYTKIGRVVTVQGYASVSSGTVNGNIRITLPFTPTGMADDAEYNFSSLLVQNTGNTNTGQKYLFLTGGPYGFFYKVEDNGTAGYMHNNDVDSNFQFGVSFSYISG